MTIGDAMGILAKGLLWGLIVTLGWHIGKCLFRHIHEGKETCGQCVHFEGGGGSGAM